MIETLNIAATVCFSQNLLLILALATGVNARIFQRPKYSAMTGIGLTVTTTLLAPISYGLHRGLEQYGMEQFTLLGFTLLALGGTYGIGKFLKQRLPNFWNWTEPALENLQFNGGILGVLILTWQFEYTLWETVMFALFGGVGFTVGLLSLTGILSEIDRDKTPKWVQGIPLFLITAGFLSFTLMGFTNLTFS